MESLIFQGPGKEATASGNETVFANTVTRRLFRIILVRRLKGCPRRFGGVSARWRTLTEAHRRVWMAVARTRKTRPRLLQCGRMPGFNYFVQVNVARVNRGLAQVDLPLEFLRALEAEAAGRPDIGDFGQPPIGPALFLRAKQFLEDWRENPQKFMASVMASGG